MLKRIWIGFLAFCPQVRADEEERKQEGFSSVWIGVALGSVGILAFTGNQFFKSCNRMVEDLVEADCSSWASLSTLLNQMKELKKAGWSGSVVRQGLQKADPLRYQILQFPSETWSQFMKSFLRIYEPNQLKFAPYQELVKRFFEAKEGLHALDLSWKHFLAQEEAELSLMLLPERDLSGPTIEGFVGQIFSFFWQDQGKDGIVYLVLKEHEKELTEMMKDFWEMRKPLLEEEADYFLEAFTFRITRRQAPFQYLVNKKLNQLIQDFLCEEAS